jgi:predicted enzyme related to lactoylglutathione lyase
MNSKIWIGQIAITVADIQTALPFYRDILGLTFLFAPGSNLDVLLAADVRVMLTTPQGAGAVGANSILYFQVEDIERAHADFVSRGAIADRAAQLAAKMADHDLWLGFLRDADGNLVGLREERRTG